MQLGGVWVEASGKTARESNPAVPRDWHLHTPKMLLLLLLLLLLISLLLLRRREPVCRRQSSQALVEPHNNDP